MRLLFAAALGVALIAGCGPAKSGKNSPGGKKPTPDAVSDNSVLGKGGEIVKPVVKPAPLPSPEEEALAKLGTAELIQELGKPHARDVASKLLLSKGEAVVPDLIGALKNEDWQVRAGAVFTLGRLGQAAQTAVPELTKLLASETNETVKDAIPYCLDAIEGR